MSSWRLPPLLLAALAAGAVLAGCVQSAPAPPAAPGSPGHPLLAGPALWNDPQDAPNSAFGWATLANPPAGPIPYWWQPIHARPLPAPVKGLELASHVDGLTRGAGIALFGRLAVVPEDAAKADVVNVTDPTHPTVLSSFETDGRGAAIVAYPTGRLVAALAGTASITLADITDPTHPQLLPPINVTSHKLGVVPGTPILYNAPAGGGGAASQLGPNFATGRTPIFDLTDPESPVHVEDFANGYGCHHIFFWENATQDKHRAICAGFQAVQLWDTKDPRHPTVVSTIPFPHGMDGVPSGRLSVLSFAHSAGLSADGKILYVGDESNGGSPPGCTAEVTNADGTAESVPLGAVWFYDVTDEHNAKVKGWWSAPNDPRTNTPDPTQSDPLNVARSCTAHHGRLIPDPHRNLLAMGFYGDGVFLIDFTDPSQPKVVTEWAQGTMNTWEVWYDGGYLFTGDLTRGMDVLRVT